MGVKVKEKIKGSGIFGSSSITSDGGRPRRSAAKRAALKAKGMIEARLVLGGSALPEEKTTPTLEQYYKTFEKDLSGDGSILDEVML